MRPAFSEIAQQLQNILREVKVINLKQATQIVFPAVLLLCLSYLVFCPNRKKTFSIRTKLARESGFNGCIHLFPSFRPFPVHRSFCHPISPSGKPLIFNCSHPSICTHSHPSVCFFVHPPGRTFVSSFACSKVHSLLWY